MNGFSLDFDPKLLESAKTGREFSPSARSGCLPWTGGTPNCWNVLGGGKQHSGDYSGRSWYEGYVTEEPHQAKLGEKLPNSS